MEAGSLDRKITLQRATETRDEFNEPVRTWATLATVSASMQPVRDAERVQAQQVGATITTRFQIRWRQSLRDLDPRDRLLFEGRTYEIASVKEIGRREGLEITAAAQAETPA